MIEEIEISEWRHFDDEVKILPYRRWLFRGQCDSCWPLKTSLYRLFEDLSTLFAICRPKMRRRFLKDKHERAMISHFKANAHLYMKSLPRNSESNLEWLSIMQHFGCPTRLLDVTASPYIGLYFAIESGKSNAAVFAFNHEEFRRIDIEVLGNDYQKSVFMNKKLDKAFIIPFEPKQTNERLVAQQGAFLVPSNNYETFNQIVNVYETDVPLVKKFVIPAHLRLEGVKRLRSMNITAASLFPGLDGFCRSLKDQVETYSQLKRFEEI